MFVSYPRPLNSPECVRHFIKNVLDFKPDNLEDVVTKVVKGEVSIKEVESHQTFTDKSWRLDGYITNEDRWNLRRKIVDELYNNQRLDNDDLLTLGSGGAKPSCDIKNESKAFIVIGLPASGKSGICNLISDRFGALILDSDYVKRKLPEYSRYENGATLVHEESSEIVFGNINKLYNFETLFNKCLNSQTNICVPKIGHDYTSIRNLSKFLGDNKYEVHLILVSLDRKESTCRALKRYLLTNRYVPLALIFDGYGNDPILSYYRLKTWNRGDFASFGKISTNVPKDESYYIIDEGECSAIIEGLNLKIGKYE